jgi:hypothetical protein
MRPGKMMDGPPNIQMILPNLDSFVEQADNPAADTIQTSPQFKSAGLLKNAGTEDSSINSDLNSR